MKIPVLAAPLLAIVLVTASFLLQGRIGLNLADEGYLWYGAMRSYAGELPIRDFQSYDPGRYHWAVAWMTALGSDGIIALRVALAAFQVCGLTLGLMALRRVGGGPLPYLLAALALLLWFFPRHKLFDLSLGLGAVYARMLLIERPSALRHFFTGAFVGFAAYFGRNHGLYSLIGLASLAVLAWARLDRERALIKAAAMAAGIVAGYSPVLFLAATQPGFLPAFVDGVLFFLRAGSTNVALPIPWPWRVDYAVPWQWGVHRFLAGMTYLAMPATYALGAIMIVRHWNAERIRRHSLFVAAIALGIAYLHYAYSRADIGHLSHSIFPFLLALLSIPELQAGARSALAAGLVAYSIFVAGLVNPLYVKLFQGNFVEIEARGERLVVDPATAAAVRAVQLIAQERLPRGSSIVFAPYWPAQYSLLGRRAPTWETYSNFSGDLSGQQRYVRELRQQRVEWALVGNAPLDGRENLRYSRTHPMIWSYVIKNYEPVSAPTGLPLDYRLYRRRTPFEPAAER